jgi:hypothetical protein
MEATTAARGLVHQVDTMTDGVEFQAVCACGWTSDWLEDDVAAVMAGVEHPEIAVGPPDPLDRIIGDLLDLQDDMSEVVVVWLAENWSADLPAPGLWGSWSRMSRPLDLTIPCRSGEELARVAAVLGCEVGGDSVYDVGGRDLPVRAAAVRAGDAGSVAVRAMKRARRVEPVGEPVRWRQGGQWRHGRLAVVQGERDGSLLVWDGYTGGARCLAPVAVQHQTRGPRGGRRWDWIATPPPAPLPRPPGWKRQPGKCELYNQLPMFGGLA